MCDKTLVYSIKLIFKASFWEGFFFDCGEKVNILAIHKEEIDTLLKNHWLINLFQIFGKKYKIIAFKEFFNHFHQNQLFTKCQPDIFLVYSCIFQLLSIVREINLSFDCDATINASEGFQDISKAFEKVWHYWILFKIKTYDVNWKKPFLLTSYLDERYQGVVLKG